MALDIHNFLARNFRGPDLAGVDQARSQNALMRNQVDRLPQQNRAQDVAIQQGEMELSAGQARNAAGILQRQLAMIASAQSPKAAAAQITMTPDFQSAAQALKLPPIQITDQDTDDGIRQQTTALLQAMGTTLSGSVPRLENSNIPSNVRVAEYYAGLPEAGDGVTRSIFNEANRAPTIREIAGVQTNIGPGATATPLSNQQSEIDFAANRKRAETEAVQSVVPADARAAAAAKSPRLAAAARRLDRVAQASAALGTGGGPLEGRARGVVGTPAAQELEAANAQLLGELTALTRVPGVGSQSDLEQRLKQLELPNATQHPSVRARSIQELEAFMNDLGAALDSVSGGSSNNDPLGIRGNP